MNWIDASWTVMAAACLTLASIHLLVWSNQRSDKAHLAFSLAGIAVATTGFFELLMMHADSAEQYAALLRWAHVPYTLLVPSLVAFVRLHLGVGRPWLGHLAWGLRAFLLIPNFTTGVNLNFVEITSLIEREAWGGAQYMTPVGVPNPWMVLGQLSSYLLLAFFLDAAVTEWRKPTSASSAQVIRICLSMVLFDLLATMWHLAVVVGGMHLPVAILPAFTGVLMVMSYELGGDVLRAGRLTRDLTATERILRQSEQRVEDAVLAAGLGTWEWDLVTGEVWLFPRARELLGVPQEEEGKFDLARFFEHVHPADRASLKLSLKAAQAATGGFVFEYRIINVDGRHRWLLARGQCERNFQHAPIRIHGVLADITERKLAEEQFRTVVESAPTAMIVVGTNGRIRFANRRAEQDFGWGRDELEEMTLEQLVPNHHLQSALRGNVKGKEMFGVRRDGREFQIEVTLSEIEVGGDAAVLISVTDIEERKRMEHDSAIQRDELAHLSRLALLAELSGSLAHELNQPLTSILSNAQAAVRFMAHEPPDLAEVGASLENIIQSDKHAGEVIRRLRTLLRKVPADFQVIDLNEVVSDVLRILHSELLNKSVSVRLALHDHLPPIEGDQVQLQQVLLNLIVNGCDAMQSRAHGRELTITSGEGSGGVEVVVSDRGHGIPATDLETIFSPFVTSKPEGMGLGLAVCRTIIEAHRGRLWATNNIDTGASLHFWLPVFDATENVLAGKS